MKKIAVEKFTDLLNIMNRLRKECPWDKKQTAESLRQYLLEETYEVLESIDNGDWNELGKELGDLLLQIVFQSEIAEEKGLFSIENVIENINKKLIERHPHVFAEKKVNSAEDVADNWEHIKMNSEKRKSIIAGIPKQAPALLFAQRMQEKASKIGFDWDKIESVIEKLDEEISELKAALDEANNDKIQEEIGDTLFTIVNISRFLKLNAEDCLRVTNAKFKKRFEYIENHYTGDIDSMKKASLKELDDLWEKAKKNDG
jgi:tetrapyrrole methylase family protein / MazG family protein